MADPARRRHSLQPRRGRSWCCTLAVPPSSPENPKAAKIHHHKNPNPNAKTGPNSVNSSPQSAKSSSLNFVTRRILSPGRVSPINSDPVQELPQLPPSPPPRRRDGPLPDVRDTVGGVLSSGSARFVSGSDPVGAFDVSLNLRGKKGGNLMLGMNSEVLIANSEVFSGLILEYRSGLEMSKCGGGEGSGGMSKTMTMCRIEVVDVDNLGVFRDTIELMFEEDVVKKLMKLGAYRAIGILEVSASIKFSKGVNSCLKYLEAVPWTEEEEEKLKSVFTMFKFNEATTEEIAARLNSHISVNFQNDLASQLVRSVTACTNANARNEMKTLVKGLLCKSSVYKKNGPDLDKEEIYVICHSCLQELINLLEPTSTQATEKPLIEIVSRQVDNINWLLEILFGRQMGEEFVDVWANQWELIKMHETASPMIRYELSRVSAMLFIAMGTRKLHCHVESRCALFNSWFGPMLQDFGWLQRCKKGLEVRVLEEALGQTLLTLPLRQQHELFMEWFRCFTKHGTECPNLGKAFQIWWRRTFLRGPEANAVESRY